VTTPLVDGFEDGDYTNNPQWEDRTDFTTVVTTNPFNGTNHLDFEATGGSSSPDFHPVYVDRGQGAQVSDGTTWGTAINIKQDPGYMFYYSLSNTTEGNSAGNAAGQGIRFRYRNGNFDIVTYDSSGNQVANQQVYSGASEDTWYELELDVNNGNNTVDARVLDDTGSVLGSASVSKGSSTTYRYTKLAVPWSFSTGNGQAYFDSITYDQQTDTVGSVVATNSSAVRTTVPTAVVETDQ